MSTIVKTFHIDIIVDPRSELIQSRMTESERKEFISTVGSINTFGDFLAGVELFLQEDGFIIDRREPSTNKDSLSLYISCHRKDSEDQYVIKMVYHFRLSDHELRDLEGRPEGSGEGDQKQYFVKTITPELSEKLHKIIKKSKYNNLALDKDQLKDLKEALDDVTTSIHELTRKV